MMLQANAWMTARDGNKSRSVSYEEFVDAFAYGLDPASRPAFVQSAMLASAERSAPRETAPATASHPRATTRLSRYDRQRYVLLATVLRALVSPV